MLVKTRIERKRITEGRQSIQTIPYNSLFTARQNAPITFVDTEVILSS